MKCKLPIASCYTMLLLSALTALSGCSHHQTKLPSSSIGNYVLPSFPGWATQTQRGHLSSSTTYSKSVQDDEVSLTLVAFNTPNGVSPPSTGADLAEIARASQQESDANSPGKSLVLTSSLMTFKGRPAYSIVKQVTVHDETTRVKSLDFADDNRLYRFRMTLKGKVIAPEAMTVANQAWDTMLQQTTHS